MITQDDVIYFILTDRFFDADSGNNTSVDKNELRRYHGGDFAGIIEKIPYLKNLGITALWITPVYLSIGRVGSQHKRRSCAFCELGGPALKTSPKHLGR